ncbi:MAG TPA: adenylosuccinate lyase, partial [Trueperaceae bacterium]|nr:adenylosuccinate lyase [Trueperaceae bacterium]
WSEAERYRSWLRVELAAMEAFEALGNVPVGSAAAVSQALAHQPLDEAFAERVAAIEESTRHDIVAFTRALGERVGDAARFVHYGLTSTDVVDSAQNLLLTRAIDLIAADLDAVVAALLGLATRYKHTPCIGRTHGIHAEPMTFGLKFLNFAAAFMRDRDRLARARESVGVVMLSGSVGTYAHVPPQVEEAAAKSLGLTADPITNQTVARDRHAELLAALALIGTSIERVALEIRHLQRTEVREAQEGFGVGQTGSSSMPHKKNPIASENLMGVARLLRSNLQAGLENVALWHERDISHSSVERIILPDSTTLASYALRRLARVLTDLVVYEDRLASNLDALNGLVFSQRVLHQLIEAGLSRENAYEVVQRNSLACLDGAGHLKSLIAADPDNVLSATQLEEAFDAAWFLRHVDAIYLRFGL